MTEQQYKTFILAAILIGIAMMISRFGGKESGANIEAPPESDIDAEFAEPYYWPHGIYPSYANLTGGSPFESIVNVHVDAPQFGGLAQQYIPMFGFVGMTAVE